jgi:hypothetical protein
MEAGDFRRAVTELGEEFERLGMQTHLGLLGQFWRAHLGKERPGTWSIDMVVEWLSLLRIDPFADRYPRDGRTRRMPKVRHSEQPRRTGEHHQGRVRVPKTLTGSVPEILAGPG